MGPSGRITHVIGYIYWIILHCLGQDMQVLYFGRAPRTKDTLPDFLKWCRVTLEFGASQLGFTVEKPIGTVVNPHDMD